MNQQTMIMVLVILFLIYGIYSTSRFKNKILCRYRSITNTLIEKWVTIHSNFVEFEGGQFRVLPDRIINMWYTRGIHQFFPTRIQSLDFSWYSDVPHDPRNFKLAVVSPEARKVMNNESRYVSFGRSLAKQMGKKQSKFGDLLPWIALLAIVVVAFYLNSQLQGQGQHIAAIENALKAITK